MDYFDHLRQLSIDDDRDTDAARPHDDRAPDDLDAKTRSLVRLGALVAGSAPSPSIRKEVDAAVSAGASSYEIVGVLDAIAPIVGRPRVVTAAPRVAIALGVDLDLLSDEG